MHNPLEAGTSIGFLDYDLVTPFLSFSKCVSNLNKLYLRILPVSSSKNIS